jgi:hypothetical protein
MDLFAGLKTIKKTQGPILQADAPVQSASPVPQTVSDPRIATVGDGGASWKLRALKRAQEKAQESGQSLDQVSFIKLPLLFVLKRRLDIADWW